MVDHDLEIEEAVFLLIHLFGHTAQWNVSPARREVAFRAPAMWTDQQLDDAMAYEREACRYRLQLVHDAGIHDLDAWIDLLHFYKTGEKRPFRPFRSFWQDGAPRLAPQAIPAFRPTQWISRHQGTVV